MQYLLQFDKTPFLQLIACNKYAKNAIKLIKLRNANFFAHAQIKQCKAKHVQKNAFLAIFVIFCVRLIARSAIYRLEENRIISHDPIIALFAYVKSQ